MRLPVRHQFLVALGLAVLILGVFGVAIFRPQIQKLRNLASEQEQKEIEVKGAKATLDRLEEVKRELDQIRARTQELGGKIPLTEDFPALLQEVQRLANEAGVNFVSVKTASLVGLPEYSELPLEITVNGYFRDLVDFLWRVHALAREIKVNGLEIAEGTNKLPHIQITIKANAFVLKKAPPKAEPTEKTPPEGAPPS